jgi:hypothetical protein
LRRGEVDNPHLATSERFAFFFHPGTLFAPSSMRSALLVSLLFVSSAFAAGRPTRAALRKAFEANRESIVEVKGPSGSGTGVIVGADGHVVTSVKYVGLDQALVKRVGEAAQAKVLLADARLGLSVVQLESQLPIRAASVSLAGRFAKGDWLVGIQVKKSGELVPTVGQVRKGPTEKSPFFEAALKLPPGTPLFDPRGRLVAVVMKLRGSTCQALPMTVVRDLLQAAKQP